MEPVAFDSLRYSRRLADVGVPKPQAELQAEVMAEAFGYYTREIVTREYLQTTLRAEFAEQNARLEQSILGKVDKRFDQLDKRFGLIDSQFAKMDVRFGQIEGRLDQMDGRFGQIERRLDHMDARFDQVDKRLDVLESDMKALTAKIHRMDKSLHLHSWILGANTLGVMGPYLRDLAGFFAIA